jgi:hypothetical protein
MRLNCKRITFLLCKERGIVVPQEFHTFKLKITSHPGQIPTPSALPQACPNGACPNGSLRGLLKLRICPWQQLILVPRELFALRAIYTFLKHRYNLIFLMSSQFYFYAIEFVCKYTYGSVRKSTNNLLGFGVADYIIFFITIYDIIFFNDHPLAIVTKMCLRNMIFSSRCEIYHPRT